MQTQKQEIKQSECFTLTKPVFHADTEASDQLRFLVINSASVIDHTQRNTTSDQNRNIRSDFSLSVCVSFREMKRRMRRCIYRSRHETVILFKCY